MSHKSFEELHQKIIDLESKIPTGSKWIHYKDQKSEHPYIVLGLALEEASEAVVVIYRREDKPKTFAWTRPVYGEKGWISEVEEGVKRFTQCKTSNK